MNLFILSLNSSNFGRAAHTINPPIEWQTKFIYTYSPSYHDMYLIISSANSEPKSHIEE